MARRISDQERIITFFQTADRAVAENTLEIVRVIVKNRFADQERKPRAAKGTPRKRAGEEATAGEGAARAAKSGEAA